MKTSKTVTEPPDRTAVGGRVQALLVRWEDRSEHAGDLTRIDEGPWPVDRVMNLPGANGEHMLFADACTGRMTDAEMDKLTTDIARKGVRYPVTIFVEADGSTAIQEGNHRVRAAKRAGLLVVPVEIRYFGNSQDRFLLA